MPEPTTPISGLLCFLEMMDLLSLGGMKGEKSTYIHMMRCLQLTHNIKCQVFILVELLQGKDYPRAKSPKRTLTPVA